MEPIFTPGVGTMKRRTTPYLLLLLLGSIGCRGATNFPDLVDYDICGPITMIEDEASSPFNEPVDVTYDRIANFDAVITWAAADNPTPTTWTHRYTDQIELYVFDSPSDECTEQARLVVPLGEWTAPETQESRLYVVWEDLDGAPFRQITAVTEDPDAVEWAAAQVEVPRQETPWGVQLAFNGDTVQMVLRTEEGFVDALPAAFQGTVTYE